MDKIDEKLDELERELADYIDHKQIAISTADYEDLKERGDRINTLIADVKPVIEDEIIKFFI